MVNRFHFQDPDENVDIMWDGVITFSPFSYNGNNVNDKRRLAIIEYDSSQVDDSLVDRFVNNYSHHSFIRITPTKAVELLNEWYPIDETVFEPIDGTQYFELDSDEFTIIDERVRKEDI